MIRRMNYVYKETIDLLFVKIFLELNIRAIFDRVCISNYDYVSLELEKCTYEEKWEEKNDNKLRPFLTCAKSTVLKKRSFFPPI